MNGKIIGVLVGLALGWVTIRYGFLQAVFLAVCAAVGWFIGRVVDGDINLADLIERYTRRDRV